MLADGEADLGVVLDDETRDCGLHMEPLGDDSLVVISQAGGIIAGRTSLTYSEVAEHPLVGLDAGSSLRRWIEKHLGPHAPVARYRTSVADLNVLVALAAAGVGLAVVPRRAIDPHQPLAVCELQDPWARRHHLLAWASRTAPRRPLRRSPNTCATRHCPSVPPATHTRTPWTGAPSTTADRTPERARAPSTRIRVPGRWGPSSLGEPADPSSVRAAHQRPAALAARRAGNHSW
ncbi:LysR substrate-binding domain-containing protein [Streptomyces sp. SID2888]|uniref:LysR substrate-binding domain-containing protein n=1 Tax=Streptomyces sp. SID2888 TaxID=2690256 RepID=UPI001F359EDF|nr:LysR substrate-binding domain-containing protein [Streptomyces sp. SID2888]